MPKLSVGDADLYYEIHGDGPPLLLVPGLGGVGAFWAAQVAELSRDFRVITHDHRGCGQSSLSRIAYSVEQMAEDLRRLMDALGLETAHLVGHSTGGAIGQILAQDRPERIPGARLEVMPYGGNFVPVVEPAAYTAALGAFLRQSLIVSSPIGLRRESGSTSIELEQDSRVRSIRPNPIWL
jgi:alpha-beta hydrolase superfamily lysophospholipase